MVRRGDMRMDEIYTDDNIGSIWSKSGDFVVCEQIEHLPDEVWLPNGWHLRWRYGETYEIVEENYNVNTIPHS